MHPRRLIVTVMFQYMCNSYSYTDNLHEKRVNCGRFYIICTLSAYIVWSVNPFLPDT